MPPRHYRFGRYKEDAADGCDMITGALDTAPWLCGICGEFTNNAAHWQRCVLCNEASGTWLCGSCAHRNPPEAKRCQLCGEPRDRE